MSFSKASNSKLNEGKNSVEEVQEDLSWSHEDFFAKFPYKIFCHRFFDIIG